MSRKSQKLRYVRVLAHWQSADSQTATHVLREVGELLVNRMVCERITQKVIRMFAPEAVFAAIKMDPEIQRYIPENLPPAEVENVYFQEPTDGPSATNVPRMRNLPRFRETAGDQQVRVSQGLECFWPTPASV